MHALSGPVGTYLNESFAILLIVDMENAFALIGILESRGMKYSYSLHSEDHLFTFIFT